MSEELNPDVLNYIDNLTKQVELERVRRNQAETQLSQTGLMTSTSGRDQNVIELQLELDATLNEIYHQLSGHIVKVDPITKSQYWAEPDDDRLKVFSYYGVKEIMNILKMYLNINTLMSFYDDDTIKWKVKDFGVELSDLFSNYCEHLLYYPSPEELFDRYKSIIEKKNLDISDDELYNKCVLWSEQELETRENLLPMICWNIINMVHSAYTRAYQGKERASLGERGININQNNQNPNIEIPIKKGGFLSRLTA